MVVVNAWIYIQQLTFVYSVITGTNRAERYERLWYRCSDLFIPCSSTETNIRPPLRSLCAYIQSSTWCQATIYLSLVGCVITTFTVPDSTGLPYHRAQDVTVLCSFDWRLRFGRPFGRGCTTRISQFDPLRPQVWDLKSNFFNSRQRFPHWFSP